MPNGYSPSGSSAIQAKPTCDADSWYTTPGFCHYLDKQLKLSYVGTLTEDVLVQLKTGMVKVSDFAQQLKTEHQQALTAKQRPDLSTHSDRL
ncbi:MAG: hypothetical protein R3E79_23330 [Caldilineaceae bacterium]